MKILIISATGAEISPLLEQLSVHACPAGKLQKTRYGNLEIDLLVTGVGIAATAYYMGKALGSGYDFALNFGLAGSFNRTLEIGDVVHVTEDRFSEMGAEDGDVFIPIEDLNLGTTGEIKNEVITRNQKLELIPKVSGITVNTVHGNEKSIESVFQRFHPYTESMEGAAFLMACQREGVVCAQIRAISNYVERRNRKAWDIPLAIKNLNIHALEILDAF
jgi:futalosine hydrolase